MYSKDAYDKTQDMQYPELMKAELTQSLLSVLVSTKVAPITPMTVETIDLFPSISFATSLSKLYDYGLIDSKQGVTPVGELVDKVYMMSTECTRMVLAGVVHGCDPIDLITIVSNTARYSTESKVLLETAKRRIKIVSDADPFFLIEHVGRYLFRYRDVIQVNLEDFIMNPEKYILPEHKTEIDTVANKLGESKVSAIDNLLKLLKEQWNSYTPPEKKVVRKLIQTMLSEYCKYLVVKERDM